MWKTALRRHKCVLVHFGLFPSELRRQHEKWQRGCKQRGQGPWASASQPAPDTAVVIPRKKLLSEKPPLCEAVINPTDRAPLPCRAGRRLDVTQNTRAASVCCVLRKPEVWLPLYSGVVWGVVLFQHEGFLLPTDFQVARPLLGFWVMRGEETELKSH